MPLLQPPSALAPRVRAGGPSWAVLSAGGTGAAALLVLGLTGHASLEAAVLAAAITFGVTLLQALRSERALGAAVEAAAEAPASGAADAILPYGAMMEALPDPVLVISAHEPDDVIGRRYVFANAAARELLKIQKDAGLLVTAVRDPDVLEAVDEALFGGRGGECVYTLGGAQDRAFRALACPLEAGPGGVRRALLVFRDETEARRVERTRADFLANASHELRTPLASLSGFIETLRGHAREDEGARERFLSIMQAQAERMSRLIDDLMSLSRIELNEHIAPSGEVDLTAAVMDVTDAVGPIARERGVEIEAKLPPRGEALVVGDRDQIVQVIQNLVDNALKYSPKGGALRIELEPGLTADAAGAGRRPHAARLPLLTPDHGQGRYAALRVADSGVGIAREHLPRLTERFYRVEGQKSGERMGTGLGLAIVKHIVNRHRGGLAVESAEGEGTCFTAYFPQGASPSAAGSPATAPDAAVVMKPS